MQLLPESRSGLFERRRAAAGSKQIAESRVTARRAACPASGRRLRTRMRRRLLPERHARERPRSRLPVRPDEEQRATPADAPEDAADGLHPPTECRRRAGRLRGYFADRHVFPQQAPLRSGCARGSGGAVFARRGKYFSSGANRLFGRNSQGGIISARHGISQSGPARPLMPAAVRDATGCRAG